MSIYGRAVSIEALASIILIPTAVQKYFRGGQFFKTDPETQSPDSLQPFFIFCPSGVCAGHFFITLPLKELAGATPR
jgi:hypothetical protein